MQESRALRILYVEDDPFDADLTRRALRKTAPLFSLDIAPTLEQALRTLEIDPSFDLMLTDLRLPDGNGISLLAHVRERQLPMAVVVITGQGDEEVAVSVLKAGANDYVIKRHNYLEQLCPTLINAYQRYQAEAMRRERPLRVLYLENDLGDREMTRQHFARHAHHIHLHIVSTAQEVLQLLPGKPKICDYDALMLNCHQQDFSALDLLKELRQTRGLDAPVILVASQGDEELAVQALRLGAYDYVVKTPGYLFRLPGLLENAYHRSQLQREQAALRASEERFRRLAENVPDIIYRFRVVPRFWLEYISPAVESITGYTADEFYEAADEIYQFIHPEDWALIQRMLDGKVPTGKQLTFRMIRKDGEIIWVESRNAPLYDHQGKLILHEGVIRDITERKLSEERIQRQLHRLNALRSIDAAITANLSLCQTLDVLLEQVIAQLGVHAAAILLYEPESQTLQWRAAKGFRKAGFESLHCRPGDSPASAAVLERRVMRVVKEDILSSNDSPQHHCLAQLWREENFVVCYGAPLIIKDQALGVLEVYRRAPFEADAEWLNFLETLAGQAAIAINNASLVEGLQQANQELLEAYDSTLEGWVRALNLRNKETEEHTRRVTEMTLRLAVAMGVDEKELVHIKRGALLHDIGKMGIPDDVLLKRGPLIESEWVAMHRHPEYARQLLSGIEYLRQAVDIPYYHHERWDGSGYPQGLKGEEIPLSARIFAVVDVWDALSSDRPYRKHWQPERVLDYIRAQAGRHFDPKVVEVFLRLLNETENNQPIQKSVVK